MISRVKRSLGGWILKCIAAGRRLPWILAIYRLVPSRLKSTLRERLTMIAGGFIKPGRWEPSKVNGIAHVAVDTLQYAAYDSVRDGVNLIGYVGGQFGIAENVRSYARALLAADYPMCLLDVGLSAPSQSNDRSLLALVSKYPVHPYNLHFYNPDQVDAASTSLGDVVFEGRYNIGFWLWELANFPGEWSAQAESFDEFWVPSDFVRDGLAAITGKPIVKIPKSVEFDLIPGIGREHFGLEPGVFTFLFSLDFHSFVARKNPQAVIAAFRHAFPSERNDVRLLIKSSHGYRFPTELSAIAMSIAGDTRIHMMDQVLSREEMYALQASTDAYVSLHRSEGFGLGMAEAMRLGKPVVATGYSGNMEFMSPAEACIVSFDLVPVGPGQYPHGEGQVWAEPHVEDAAQHMRALVDHPERAAQLGAAASARIRSGYSHASAASAIGRRIREIEKIQVKDAEGTGV